MMEFGGDDNHYQRMADTTLLQFSKSKLPVPVIGCKLCFSPCCHLVLRTAPLTSVLEGECMAFLVSVSERTFSDSILSLMLGINKYLWLMIHIRKI